MKKILLTSIVLAAFALSLTLFELSCKKTANAQSSSYVLPIATTSKLGGVIPDGSTISVDGTGKISAIGSSIQQQNKILYGTDDGGFGIANYDGSGAQEIKVVLPAGFTLDAGDNLQISPDHKTIFFAATDTTSLTRNGYSFSCNVDGSNVRKIIESVQATPF